MGETIRTAVMLDTLAAIAAAQTVEVRTAAGVQKMPVESLVGAAMAGEMGGFGEIEALKAMAVVARTCFRVHAGRHRKEGLDFCATTHCQRMHFFEMPALVRQAAGETKGVLLWWKGSPAAVFHSADCGGRSAAAGETWPGLERPYLVSRPDP